MSLSPNEGGKMSIGTKEYGFTKREYNALDLFSFIVEDVVREDKWFSIEDVGYFKYEIIDNAGSLLIEYKRKYSNDYSEAIMKILFYGTYGNKEGKGCLYTKLVKGMFREKVEFETYEEARNEVIKVLEKMI